MTRHLTYCLRAKLMAMVDISVQDVLMSKGIRTAWQVLSQTLDQRNLIIVKLELCAIKAPQQRIIWVTPME